MGDVALGVASMGAQGVGGERQRGGEAGEREMASAEHPGVGEGVEVGAGLLDQALEALGIAGGVAQRAVDADVVDGRADLAGQLGVEDRGLLQGILLVGADEAIAAVLVAHGGAQALPASPLPRALARPRPHRDVDGQGGGQRAREQMRQPGRVGGQRRRGQIDRLLDRAVAVADPRRVLAGPSSAGGSAAMASRTRCRTADAVRRRWRWRSGRRRAGPRGRAGWGRRDAGAPTAAPAPGCRPPARCRFPRGAAPRRSAR